MEEMTLNKIYDLFCCNVCRVWVMNLFHTVENIFFAHI